MKPRAPLLPRRPVHLLLGIARDCDRALRKVCAEFVSRAAGGRNLPPAAVWLVDNYAFLHAQLREVRDAIPPGYEKHLAKLTGGLLWGHPRIYLVAFEAIAHAGGPLTQEALCEFLDDYQREKPLTLAELWALGPLLKLALAQKICVAAQESLDAPASEDAVRDTIRSLRNLETTPWSEVVESASRVERALRRDPVYARLDRQTRDGYRRAVEAIAKGSGWSEERVAEETASLWSEAPACHPGFRAGLPDAGADAGVAGQRPTPQQHVGYYLIGPGREILEARTGYRPKPRESLQRRLYRYPNVFYLGGIASLTAAILALAWWIAAPAPWWFLLLLALPASQTAVSLMNLLVNAAAPPRRLPRMDFSEGIPGECRTFVVVPTLLTSRPDVQRLLERLEIHYLANRDPNLLFALLTDFPDSATPAGDESLLRTCSGGIRTLNRRYGSDGKGPFYLFHRPLRWNAGEGVWMGHERKRGKLNDFNALLRGEDDAFSHKIGDLSVLPSVRYVITLDSDTQLPRDAARGLVATIAHPLNQAVIDPLTNTVRRGYGLLQPRVSISMESAARSRLARIHSGQTGFDPYTTAVSDVYQDLHGQASFTGKGIYEVAVFHKVAGRRFPENRLLSHDLIEGEHVRAGLVTDLEVIDDFPSTCQSYSKRRHRWARGDWQIVDWIFSGHLPLVSRWKIFDNLRRSLFEIALLVFLLAGWSFLPGRYLTVTLAAVALLLAPAHADTLLSLFRFPPPKFWAAYVRETAFRFSRAHLDALVNLAFLPHQALLMGDAVLRTMCRRFVTHRRMLEWQTMAQAEADTRQGLDLVGRYLLAAPALALVTALVFIRGQADLLTAAFLELWVVAPLAALWLNGKPRRRTARPGADAAFLRDVSLRTWRYFVDFGGPEQGWLAPDNVQEDPPAVARRTSPTNLGLQLAAHVAAYDFGYLTFQEAIARLDRALEAMAGLERFRGHFYNWYDTASLAPLEPLFVSTVDSGNLAAALIAVKQFCLAAGREPALDHRAVEGLRDHCARLRAALPREARTAPLMRAVAALDRQLSYEPADLFGWESLLSETGALVERLRAPLECAAERLAGRGSQAAGEVRYWYGALAGRLASAFAALYAAAPWLEEPYESELRPCAGNPRMAELMARLSRVVPLAELPAHHEAIARAIRQLVDPDAGLNAALRGALEELPARLDRASAGVRKLLRDSERQAELVSRWVKEMDFAFLFDHRRKLLHIGCDAATGALDPSYYDLLASEARSAVFLAIAKGDIPREAWFHLGRRLTSCRGQSALVSWSGTMFEYLTPSLFLKSYDGTLLAESLQAVIRVQQEYARSHNAPWGVSEAAYAMRDHAMIYQYRPFGIPELSANPALSSDLVIAPYATMLAAMADRAAASANLRLMEANGWTGRYGFYESIDYAARPGVGRGPTVVRAYMAHHQAMGLLALCNTVLGCPMNERFHADPLVQATEYLLQERLPAMLEITDEQQKASLEFRLPAVSTMVEKAS